MKFESYDLDPRLVKALAESNYLEPTEIQERSIPLILQKRDLKASAQTGTGKTAAFLVPLLQRLLKSSPKKERGPRALILVPTRELAVQVTKQAEKYSKHLSKMKVVRVFGGEPYHSQIRNLSKPCDILVATPGRLMDLMERGKCPLHQVELFVLDEADRMLDLGFLEPVQRIYEELPSKKQVLFFSATLKGAVENLAKQFLKGPEEVIIAPPPQEKLLITEQLLFADSMEHKQELLSHILEQRETYSTIIFTATKRHADELAVYLKKQKHQVAALHGDMNQRQRLRTLQQLREGKLHVLVATDVASRGIDVPGITHVINFDLPRVIEDYVHRIGRTGRAKSTGVAISFVSRRDRSLVPQIEKYTGQSISVSEIEGLEPKQKDSFTDKEHPRKNRSFPRRKRGFSAFKPRSSVRRGK